MHLTDVTLGVYKQSLNAGLLQQHHFLAGLIPLNLPKNDVVVIALHSDFVSTQTYCNTLFYYYYY